MSLPFPDCDLFKPTAPRHNERPTDKNLIILLPLIHPGHADHLQALLKAYISSFRGQSDVSLVLYMPEPHYALEALEQWLEAEGDPETQPDIALMLDPMLASAEPELYLNADAVIALEADSALMLKVLALNRKMLCFGELPTDLPFENWVQILPAQNLISSLQQLYEEHQITPYSRPWVLEHMQEQLLAASTGRPLLYVPSQRHLAHLGKDSRNYLMLSDDFETYVQCLEKGLPCLLAQSFLDQEPQLYEGDQASQIASSWHQGQLAVNFHGHNLLEHCQYDLWYTFRGCLHMATVFERVYQTYRPTALYLFDEFVQPQFWDPAAGPFPDPKNAVLAFLAEQRGMSWQKLSPPPRGPIRSQGHSNIPESQNNRPDAWFLTPDKIKQLKSSYRHVILGIGSHLDLAEQGLLAEDLWQREDTLYLFLRTYPFPIDTPSACFADLSFFLLHPEIEPEIKTLKQTIQIQWEEFTLKKSQESKKWSFLISNPYMRFQIDHFLASLLEAARHIFAAEQLVRLFKPELCLLGNGAGGAMRSLTASLNRHGVITYRIFHGSQIMRELYTPVTRLLLKGDKLRADIQNAQIRESSAVIGDLRKLKITHTSFHTERELSKIRQHKQNRPLILILTSHLNYGLYVGQHNLKAHLEYWNQIIALAKQHPELAFAIKHHPRYDSPGFYSKISQHSENILLLDPGLGYDIMAPLVDICILVYAFSTVAYEVYKSEKPLVFFTGSSHPLYNVPLCVNNQERKLQEAIKVLLTNKETRAFYIQAQRALLKRHVAYDYQEGHTKLKKYLEQDLQSSKPEIQLDSSIHTYMQLANGLTATKLSRDIKHWQNLKVTLTDPAISNQSKTLYDFYTHIINQKH